MDAPRCHPYASGRFTSPDDEPLRPGGLALSRRLIALAAFPAGARVLDLGCGDGASLGLLGERRCRPIGVDLAPRALAAARQRYPAAAFAAADGTRLPFASGSLDGILAECSLSLMTDRRRALAECRRVLAPGAPLAVLDVCRRTAGAGSDTLPACLARMSTPDNLQEEIEQAGFVVAERQDHSDALKAFAARLIFANGSLAALWAPSLPASDANAFTAALRAARPGYFLFLAQAR
ncbi:DVU_1556 family methyltransferase [Paludibacterium sp.]|uniref:DVU_1556 family methyltransferase n=1 Tax=Paludibacterium sp. TaxID=1917523 RepID=UPI0025EF3454|nr:class I SAM-dependent methyltransferase [Paludibacterium sp.]